MLYFNGKPYFVPFIESSSTGGIIYVDELPTEGINENAFYCVDGRYYRWIGDITCVFKDVLNIPYTMYGKSYYFSYSSNGVNLNAMHFIDDLGMHTIQYANDESSYHVYNDSTGWDSNNESYKTITIHEMPTDETFLAWIDDNADKYGGWQEYVPVSGGSGIVGTWVFEDILEMRDTMYGKTYRFSYSSNGVNLNEIQFSDDGAIHYISYANSETGYYAEVYDDNIGWHSNNESYKTIQIIEEPTDEVFIAWLNANARKKASGEESELPRYDGKPIGGRFINEYNENAFFRAEVDVPIVVESYLDTRVPLEQFGNAQPSDVRKGVTFTSSAGAKVEGTNDSAGEIEGDSVVGTWVFKDDPVPNGYEDVVYNKTYHFDYYTIEYDGNDVPIGVCEFDKMNFEFDGSYFRISYYGNDFSALPAYDSSTQTGWSHDSLKTITITKSPTDERFISWLKENATKQASEPTGVSVAVVNKLPTKNIRQNTLYRMNDNYYKRNETNVLVFNDALSVPEKMYSKAYPLSFSVNVANGPVLTFTEIAFGSMGEVSFYTNGAGIDSAYADGWKDEKYKTITIDEMPTDEVLLEWLRSNAMAEGSWDEYAETTSITPTKSETWVFNEELTGIDKPFANGFEDVACSGYMLYDYGNEPFNFHFSTIRFCFDSKHSMLESIRLINSETDGISIYYIDAFVYSFRHRTITFTELPDDEVFLAWLKANARKISGGSSGTGAITEIQTPEELDNILANATSSDVGKAYFFVGESNGKYKNNSIYIIREV